MPAKTAQDLKSWNKNNPSQKTYIQHSNDGNTITVYFCDEEGKELTAIRAFMSGQEQRPHGKIHAVKIKPSDGIGECRGAYVIKITHQTLEGWGPMLYDCVITLAGESGLTPDRASITPEATNVWKIYYNKRSDVKKEPLDIDGEKNDDKSDDCESLHSILSASNPELEAGSPTLDIVNHVYYDAGIPTLHNLESMDLIFPPKKTEIQELYRIYHDFLKEVKSIC